MKRKFTRLTAALALLVFMMPSLAGWGQGLSTADLTWPTPQLSESFDGLDLISSSEILKTNNENLTEYGIFNKMYNNSTSNTYAIADDETFDSRILKLTAGSSSPLMASITKINGNSITFGSTGAFSLKMAKTNKSYFGLYAENSATEYARAKSSVYLKNTQGVITIYNGSTFETVANSTNDIFEVCVIYNNTTDETTYGDNISLAAKTAHIFIDGICVMNGTTPKAFSLPGSALVAFRVFPQTTSGNACSIDDVNIYNALPTAPTSTTYSVFYNANGATEGTVPEDDNEYDSGDNVTVLGNTGNLAKTGNDWVGWCLNPEGTGTVYGPSPATTTYSITGNTTFYAKWTPRTHTVTMPSNNTCGNYSMDATNPVAYGTEVTLTYEPAEGYQNYQATWTVTDANNNNIAVTNNKFTMPDANVNVTVVVAEATSWTYTHTANDGTGNVAGTWVYVEDSKFKMQQTKGSGSTSNMVTNATEIRLYQNHYLELSPVSTFSKAMTSVVITCQNGYADELAGSTFIAGTSSSEASSLSSGDVTYSGNVVTIDLSHFVNCAYLKITATAQSRFTSVTVNYTNPIVITNHNITYASGLTHGSWASGNPESANNGALVTVTTTPESGYFLASMTYSDDGGSVSGNATIDGNTGSFLMPDTDVTITAVFTHNITYTLATSIVPGRHYIITDGTDKAMALQNTNNRAAVDVEIENDVATVSSLDVYEFVFSGPDTDGYYTIYDKNDLSTGYLYAVSGSNYLKTDATLSSSGKWSIEFDNNIANLTVSFGETTRQLMYNSTNDIFSCYTTDQEEVYLFEKETDSDYEFYSNTTLASATIANDETYTVHKPAVLDVAALTNNGTTANLVIEDGAQLITSNAVAATMQKDVEAYSSATGAGNTDGWYFIASPINSNSFAPTTAMLTGTYDLYRLNPTTTKWENRREHDGNAAPNFNLENGRGYLYANNVDFTIDFAGTVKASAASQDVSVSAGWNLVGNPFTYNTYLNRAYYKMNEDRKGIEAVSDNAAIAPCTGVLVEMATSGNVTFTKTAQTMLSNGNLQMTVAQQVVTRGESSSQTLDNAIVSFNEGNQLEKFYFGTQNANLYIPQGTEEYAIVSSEAQGEMPVSFRANENGQYTLTVNPEGVEMNYLHLIDNMTGADIDLLQTPSYTFNAKTTDYESRFRLVFAANNEDGSSTGSETFSFYSNGSWVISNEGEATLQVIDALGRILSSEEINGSVSKSIDAPAGVYVLRLINGDSVRTQKIVVR